MEADHRTSGACRHGKSMKLESHFSQTQKSKESESERERERERDAMSLGEINYNMLYGCDIEEGV